MKTLKNILLIQRCTCSSSPRVSRRQVPLLCLLLVILQLQLPAQNPQTAAVQTRNGQPVLVVNGQPELPFFYALTHVVGGRWSWEELPAHHLRQMAAAGIRLYQVDLWLEDLWPEKAAHLDLALARRQIRGVLDACPHAAVVVRLHVNAPRWWARAHPDECVYFANGPLEDLPEGLPFNHEDGDPDRARRASLASWLWQKEAGEKTAEFCRRLARTREGKAVIGIHVAGGVYGEWHSWGFVKNEPDVSAPMQSAFRNWLKNKYLNEENLRRAWGDPEVGFETAAVPDTLVRHCCADSGSVVRNPARERQLLDFYHCQQQVVAGDIEFFCRTVKDNWPRPLIVGVFYGYAQFGLCRQAVGGHLEVERLLGCPWIDYFAGPPSYFAESRKAGGSGLERGLVRSVQLHGKLWFDEIDNGYLQNKREADFVRSQALGDTMYLPLLQRSLWLPLMQGAGLWLYDFGPRRNTGWWDSPMYLDEIRRTRDFFSKKYALPAARPAAGAEVLVVWDPESFYHIENAWTRSCERGLDAAVEDLQRAGVTTEHLYFFDLQRVNLDACRVVVFMNAWALTPEQRRFVRDSVAREGRMVVWNYLSGYSDGNRTGQDLAEDLTGFVFQKITPAVSQRWRMDTLELDTPERVGPVWGIDDPAAEALARRSGPDSSVVVAWKETDWGAAVCATVPLHGKAVWRAIFQKAGCHIFAGSDDFVFAADGFLLYHTAGSTARRITFTNGKYVEVWGKRTLTWFFDAVTGDLILK